MKSPRLQPGKRADTAVQLNAPTRRSLVVLCVVYLIFGTVDLSRFLCTDLGGRLADAADARAALVAAEAESGAALPSVEQEARRHVADTTGALHRSLGRVAGLAAGLLIIIYFLFIQRPRATSRQHLGNAVTLMILLLGLVLLASRLVFQRVSPNFAAWGIVDLFVLHAAACAILPWTPKECSLPFAPLLLVWAVTFLVPKGSDLELLDRVVVVIMSPVALLPGIALAGWRMHRMADRAERLALGQRVESLGGELFRARIVHDAMFPDPFSGHVAFEYDYQPIQEIGGDYVHAHVCPSTEKVIVTLLDVAGHGLAAALTVNRLFGELERILAENTAAEPAEVMDLLNRYINLTMARHSMFATGACMMIDPNSGELKWVSAGHPPAFLRQGDGSLTDLPTTAMMLGALDPVSFDPAQSETKLHPGDVVIAYTDGAFEARDAQGHRFGIERMRQIMCFDPPPRSWPTFIANAVAAHHGGNAEDDILIVSLRLSSLRVVEPEHCPA